MPRRHYSDDERAAALAMLRANGGNVSSTNRLMGGPYTTMRQWATGERCGKLTHLRHQKKRNEGVLAGLFERAVWELLERVGGKLEDAPVDRLMIAAGIAVDKWLLLCDG
jgi:transposase-like protein